MYYYIEVIGDPCIDDPHIFREKTKKGLIGLLKGLIDNTDPYELVIRKLPETTDPEYVKP